ncbi:MAG: hypothetical protein J4F31_00285 [Flavobacteriales bacterium]|nr:hypothetical protein [Flavobacteriales bacterium]
MRHGRFIYMPQVKQIALFLFVCSALLSWGQGTGASRHDAQLPLEQSSVVFELDLLPELPEALAFDPIDSLWYFGMVKTGNTYRYDPRSEKLTLYLGGDNDGRYGVFSMEIDPKERRLYVLSSPITAFHGENASRCTLFEYELNTRVLLALNDFYDGDERRLLGDMERYSDGTLFISDSYYPAILKQNEKNELVEFIFRPDLFKSLQGLAMDQERGILYAADYRNGLFAIDIFTGEVLADTVGIEGYSLQGIDGLSPFKPKNRPGTLYAVQNGVRPMRVTAVGLSEDGRTFRAAEALDWNIFFRSEPTNGVFIGNEYYYIGNSPWPFFDDSGEPQEHEIWESKLEIRKVELID